MPLFTPLSALFSVIFCVRRRYFSVISASVRLVGHHPAAVPFRVSDAVAAELSREQSWEAGTAFLETFNL